MALISSCVSSKTGFSKAETAQIVLDGNPTTGYSWEYSETQKGIVEISEKIEYTGKGNIVGAPSVFTYTIRPVKAGSTELRFKYRRSWENVPAAEEKNFRVEVSEDGSVTVSEI